ncbi:MAG TPA: hypothetical protein VM901_05400 [Bdellovibrionota bacterium]|jgi:hypothetical protein|nr:hypothetical protein [Bdellovibrionota bacterium]
MKRFCLPYLDYVRSVGVGTYLTQVLVHEPLSALILFLVMNPLFSNAWDWQVLASSHVYFVPYFALLSAMSSLESEHFLGVSEEIHQRPLALWLTRLPFVFSQTVLPVAFFATLVVLYLPSGWMQLGFLLFYWAIFASLGIFFIANWGFRKEKSVNNSVNLVPWFLALGPGPFLEARHYPWFAVFPGSGLKSGNYEIEIAKGILLVIVLAWLIIRSKTPRPMRIFRLG